MSSPKNYCLIYCKPFWFYFFMFLLYINYNVLGQCTYLSNTSFEATKIANGTNSTFNQNTTPRISPWRTTATDNMQELWSSGFRGVPAYDGSQFIELNAYQNATTYQNFTATGGTTFTLNFAHRGREGVDVMHVGIGTPNPTQKVVNQPALNGTEYINLGNFSDDNTKWGYYSVTFTLPTGVGNNFSVRFTAVSSTGGSTGLGNFLDNVSIGLPAPILTTKSANIVCPASTLNLNTTFIPTNAGAVTWHTNSVATSANKIANPTAVGGGKYYAAFYESSTGCYTATEEVTVVAPPAITVAATSASACIGGAGRLTASGASTYLWSNGETTASILVSTPGVYTVTGSNASGCLSTATATFTIIDCKCTYLTNTSFEDTQISGKTYGIFNQNTAPKIAPWRTTASDKAQEVWRSGFNGVPAYDGNQFIELNAHQAATIYQNFTATGGTTFTLNFAHRGRNGADVMHVGIGTPDPTQKVVNQPALTGVEYIDLGNFTDGKDRWGYYSVSFTLPTGVGSDFSVRFTSVSSAGGNNAIGNFLDNISIGLPAPILNKKIVDIVCPVSTVDLTTTFSASNAGTITWHTNSVATENNLVPDPTAVTAGKYYAAFYESSTGCYTGTEEVTVRGIPDVMATSATVCKGSEGELIASGASTYLWSTGETTASIFVSTPGTYTVTGTDENGCTGTDVATFTITDCQCTYLDNTSFEDTQISGKTYGIFNQNTNPKIAPWRTTATDNSQEVWKSGFNGVAAYDGNQFIELNAHQTATIYQNFTATGGTTLTLNFAHRGRNGADVMHVGIGTPNPTQLFMNQPALTGTEYIDLGNFTDGKDRWGYYSVTFTLPNDVGDDFSVRFTSVSSAGGNNAIGNFLDNISIGLPAPVLLTKSADIICPESTIDLTTTFLTSDASLVTWHTNSVATDDNKVLDPTAAPAGKYYASFYDNHVSCYTATEEVIVTSAAGTIEGPISACSGKAATTNTYTSTYINGIWSVSPSTLASIDPVSGELTSVEDASGIARITYTLGNCSTTMDVEISPENCTSLPVKLISFNARKTEVGSSSLEWKTAGEINSEKFEIQHSTDLKNWTVIASVAANGETDNTLTYSYVHTTPANNENLYRLRIVDKDGTFSLSHIVSLSFDNKRGFMIHPNPTSHFIELSLDSFGTWSTIKSVKIYDARGIEILSSKKVTTGQIDVRNLKAGVYTVLIVGVDGRVYNEKFIKEN